MKYKIAFVLLVSISIFCMSCGDSSTLESSSTDSSDNFYHPEELPFSMPYYDGEIIIKDFYIVEEYKDYEYNADYLLRADVSNLSDKDYHWFKEENLNLLAGAIMDNNDEYLTGKGTYSISVNDVFIRFPIYQQKRDSISTGKSGYVNLFYSCDDTIYSMDYSFDFSNVMDLSELKETDTDIYNFYYGKYVRHLTEEEVERADEPIIDLNK